MRARVHISLTSRLWQTIINFRLINDGLMIRRLHHEDDGKYQRVMIVNGSGLTWSVTGVYLLNLELIPSDHPRSLFIFGPSFGIWTVLWPIVCSSFSIILYSLSLSSIIFSPPLVAFLWVELTHEVQSIHTYSCWWSVSESRSFFDFHFSFLSECYYFSISCLQKNL